MITDKKNIITLKRRLLPCCEETKKAVLEKIEIHCLKKYGSIAGLKIFKELKEELKNEKV